MYREIPKHALGFEWAEREEVSHLIFTIQVFFS